MKNRPKRIEKGWGFEDIVVNKEEYCGKCMFFKKGKRCSMHFHVLKDETFYVSKGKVVMKWLDNEDMVNLYLLQGHVPDEIYNQLKFNETILEAGDSFWVPRRRLHQVIALEDTDVFEFSTEHFDDDSLRIRRGD